ncbi:Adenine DNA glycosylase [Holothuria leucospilota]|uniref:Adenine DNA glycosylase n=1 Tax=Holothuria leucospilota TaxID=206669 RepID=A0A9Q1C937_HOLLE|nr:Adenine DNA glycosylase [Holothuria leucospilota]
MKRKQLSSSTDEDSAAGSSSLPGSGEICSAHSFQDDFEVSSIRSNLLGWYDENKRDLPWRKCSHNDVNRRLYEVWVSEIMCQQTQVGTVINYYNKWIKKWPTVERLAKASVDQVIEAWAGLGYYSRGRRLLEGSQVVMNDLDGKIPHSSAELMKRIPGVGRYTACAIASISCKEPVGVVDGNVIRVLSRMRCIGADTSQPATMEYLWSLANNLVDHERPGDFNQSVMELGATVCTPKNPACSTCPVSGYCMAYKKVEREKKLSEERLSGKTPDENENVKDIEDTASCSMCLPSSEPWDKAQGVMNFPRKAKKKPPREQKNGVCLVQKMTNDGHIKYLMVQRPEKGLLASMWEFPSVEISPDCTETKRREEEEQYLNLLGVKVQKINQRSSLGDIVHIFSHIRQTYEIDLVVALEDDITESEPETDQNMKWVTSKEMEDMGISTAMKKVFGAIDGSTTNKNKRRKQDEKNQPKLDRFFKRKTPSKT